MADPAQELTVGQAAPQHLGPRRVEWVIDAGVGVGQRNRAGRCLDGRRQVEADQAAPRPIGREHDHQNRSRPRLRVPIAAIRTLPQWMVGWKVARPPAARPGSRRVPIRSGRLGCAVTRRQGKPQPDSRPPRAPRAAPRPRSPGAGSVGRHSGRSSRKRHHSARTPVDVALPTVRRRSSASRRPER